MRRKRGVSIVHEAAPNLVYQHQADATLTQASPGDATEYTVLDTTKNVRIYSMEVDETDTGAPTSLVLNVYIDGVKFIYTKANPVSATAYFPEFSANWAIAAYALDTNDRWAAKSFMFEGRSVKITASVGGDAPNTSQLHARVKYAKIP